MLSVVWVLSGISVCRSNAECSERVSVIIARVSLCDTLRRQRKDILILQPTGHTQDLESSPNDINTIAYSYLQIHVIRIPRVAAIARQLHQNAIRCASPQWSIVHLEPGKHHLSRLEVVCIPAHNNRVYRLSYRLPIRTTLTN